MLCIATLLKHAKRRPQTRGEGHDRNRHLNSGGQLESGWSPAAAAHWAYEAPCESAVLSVGPSSLPGSAALGPAS